MQLITYSIVLYLQLLEQPQNICIQLFMGEDDGLKEKGRQRKFEKNA